jgi:hypothetical protein
MGLARRERVCGTDLSPHSPDDALSFGTSAAIAGKDIATGSPIEIWFQMLWGRAGPILRQPESKRWSCRHATDRTLQPHHPLGH